MSVCESRLTSRTAVFGRRRRAWSKVDGGEAPVPPERDRAPDRGRRGSRLRSVWQPADTPRQG